MKKTFIALVLIVAMLSLSATAYAENETSATMTVNYEFTAPEPPDPPPTSTYVVNIPSSITNDSMGLVEITASENTLPSGKILVVTYDPLYSTCISNGHFRLYKDGDPLGPELGCRILVYSNSEKTQGKYLDVYNSDGKQEVAAAFPAGSTTPSYGGFLEFVPSAGYPGMISGTYIGTVHFNIEVRDVG